MSTVQIPLHNQSFFTQDIDIAEQTFVFEFLWNQRAGYYLMHIYDFEEQPIALGVKLFCNWPLLRNKRCKFPGDLILLGETQPNPFNFNSFQLICNVAV